MRFFRKASLVLFPAFLAAVAVAQIPQGTFKHIIIVVQENRTPDNLFGAGPSGTLGGMCGTEDPFMPGVDIVNGGYNNTTNQTICNMSLTLSGWDPEGVGTTAKVVGPIDPDHSYNPKYPTPWGWVADYDYNPNTQTGNMDGFCHEYGSPLWPHPCPSYSYVPLGDPSGDTTPYYSIAKNYGFANYMFQTNEGPSFEAHQFLFTGTSAPVAPGDTYNFFNLDFVAELKGKDYGCHNGGAGPNWVYPDGSEHSDQLNSECYAHDTLVTAAVDCQNGYCDRPGITWGYYAPSAASIWMAPMDVPQTCYGQASPPGNPPYPPCYTTPGTEYGDHVHIATQNGYSDAPIFDALKNCTLPEISWVIPDAQWSDHPVSSNNKPLNVFGPSWVADIVNAVGGGITNSKNNCNAPGSGKYWSQEPTAVIVVWDDWGGWFDHVDPNQNQYPGVWTGSWNGSGWTCAPPQGSSTGWGCGYVHGFRVPLLVVSPYTGTYQNGTYSPWVSGACGPGQQSSCPNNVFPYVHDFGSILAFTEWNFKMPFIDGPPDDGYADYNAPDWTSDHQSYVPLSDFFQIPLNNARPFQSIPTDYGYTCFTNVGSCWGSAPYVPQDPDDD